MRAVQQVSEQLDVVLFQCIDGAQHPFVLGHDVTRPPVADVVEQGAVLVEHRGVDIAKGQDPAALNPKLADRSLALGAPAVVRGAIQGALHASVADDDPGIEVQRHGEVGQIPAIEEEGRPFLRQGRHELIHDAALDADEVPLRRLAKQRHVRPFDPQICETAYRLGRRHLERRGAAQPRSDRHVPRDEKVHAGERETPFQEHRHHATDVVVPGGVAILPEIRFRLEFRTLGEVDRDSRHPAIAARRGQNGDLAIDRGGENEPVVVVGMLPDQVDAAGRANAQNRWMSELPPESFFELRCRDSLHPGLRERSPGMVPVRAGRFAQGIGSGGLCKAGALSWKKRSRILRRYRTSRT